MQRIAQHALVAVLPWAALAAGPGCHPDACTLVGWQSGLSLEIATSGPPVAHTLEVAAAGEVLSVQLAPIDGRLACVAPCAADGVQLFLRRDDFRFGEPNPFVVVALRDNRGPTSATVNLYREGVLVHTETLEPRYDETYPNGDPECGIARNASATIAVAP